MNTRTTGLAGVVALSAAVAAAVFGQNYPDREAFVASNPKPAAVPVEAFEMGAEAAGLKIEVWATTPQVFSPVTMDIDPQGRVWAVEGVDYQRGRSIGDGTSIVVLSDTDDDGRADASHVFVAERNVRAAPLGIAVFDNVVILSATPSIIVYTDVDRDAKFDANVDKREVFLTGFHGGGHDHTLHAVVPSPGGEWYFSFGNMGANVKTKDGRHFIAACYYGNAGDIGKNSSDGRRYIGGLAMRINPDGTGLSVIGQNLRNTHDMVVTSFGDVLHNDNDDPAHCRATWLMEHGNLGYADLIDGSKAWEEVAKPWEEQRVGDVPAGYEAVHGKSVPRISASHWRENYPGTLPPGDVYGPGSPTGVTFIEGDELGEAHRGTYLACDMVHKAVLAYRPKLTDAQIHMQRTGYFVSMKPDSKGQPFLPTDVTVGTDGAIYLADFYSDTSRAASNHSGTIYRITRADGRPMKRPMIDLDTTDGQLAALANANPGVRFVAMTRLAEKGEPVLEPAKAFYTAHAGNAYIQARAVWLLARLGDGGRGFVENLLTTGDVPTRIVAFRALRLAHPDRLMTYAKTAAGDPAASVRREAALALHDVKLDDCRDALSAVIAGYDGKNRWYLEAIGAAATGKEQHVYAEVVRPTMADKAHAEWDDRAKTIAWRLHTDAAVDDLDKVIRAQKPKIDEFRRLIMGFTIYDGEDQRAKREKLVEALAGVGEFAGDDYQLTISEVLLRDLRLSQPVRLAQDYRVPTTLGNPTNPSAPAEIVKLAGDAERGKLRAAMCTMCHRIDGTGAPFGPDLSAWGRQRTIEEIARELVNPAEKLAHGYEQPVRISGRGHVAEGFLVNYAYHAGFCKVKVMGGQYLKLAFRDDGLNVEHLKNHSWMPSAAQMGLSDQDIRDIAEYLRTK